VSIKYALFPGPVTSKTDGDRHFVDAPTLAFCYGVRLAECLVVPAHIGERHPRERELLLERIERQGLIKLHPRSSGNYTLPTA
jgi:hypothetical protein